MTGEALGQKLLQSVRQMKTGRAARTTPVEVSPIVEARNASGLSPAQFAVLLGVSVRTLQECEQGRREPIPPRPVHDFTITPIPPWKTWFVPGLVPGFARFAVCMRLPQSVVNATMAIKHEKGDVP